MKQFTYGNSFIFVHNNHVYFGMYGNNLMHAYNDQIRMTSFGGVTQLVEHLPNKHEVLSSKPSTAKNKQTNNN
jgi:hypothetical protein